MKEDLEKKSAERGGKILFFERYCRKRENPLKLFDASVEELEKIGDGLREKLAKQLPDDEIYFREVKNLAEDLPAKTEREILSPPANGKELADKATVLRKIFGRIFNTERGQLTKEFTETEQMVDFKYRQEKLTAVDDDLIFLLKPRQISGEEGASIGSVLKRVAELEKALSGDIKDDHKFIEYLVNLKNTIKVLSLDTEKGDFDVLAYEHARRLWGAFRVFEKILKTPRGGEILDYDYWRHVKELHESVLAAEKAKKAA